MKNKGKQNRFEYMDIYIGILVLLLRLPQNSPTTLVVWSFAQNYKRTSHIHSRAHILCCCYMASKKHWHSHPIHTKIK